MFGYPLVLRRWSEFQNSQKAKLGSLPIGVKLPNLKLSCKSVAGLSILASSIGRPICMDKETMAGTRLAYAKVLVDQVSPLQKRGFKVTQLLVL